MPRVFFYIADPERGYYDDVVPLAEGLTELGVPVFGSANYWFYSPGSLNPLVPHDPDVGPEDCDIVVVPYTWPLEQVGDAISGNLRVIRRPLPAPVLEQSRRWRTVFFDFHDGYRTVSWEKQFRVFDQVFRCKYNSRVPHPENHRPWQLGFSNRVLMALGKHVEFSLRKPELLVNFGASHPWEHGCRRLARQRLVPRFCGILRIDSRKDDLALPPSDPMERLMWAQTQRRHSQAYYDRLRSAVACACFCGEVVPPAPHDPGPLLEGGNRAKLRRWFWSTARIFDPRPDRIIQWDSWRFWEALAAGAVAIHVDLEAYGVALPVMPKNWEHYIGVDLRRPKAAIDRIMDEPDCLERVGTQGRAWVLEHYAPKAVAQRFLNLLGFGVRNVQVTAGQQQERGLRRPCEQ